jgi:hypothetical protein
VAVGLVALVAASSAPRIAVAQTTADKLAAQRLLSQGNQAVGEGDYLTAIERFKKAYARFPSPKILVNIGSTQRLLGRYADAAATYEQFLADPTAEKARIPEVTRALREIDALLARIRVVVPDTQASVRLDGKEIPKFTSGVVLRIDPGEHTVSATRDGYLPALKTVPIRAGEEATVTLELRLPEKIIVRTAGPQRIFGFVVGGLGAAGVITGLALGGAALADKHSAAGHCFGATTPSSPECDAEAVSLDSRASTFGNAATGAFIAGLALVGVGVTLVLTAPSTTTVRTTVDRPDKVALSVGADGSVRLGGAW